MGKVIFNMSMSLDGFVDGPNNAIAKLFKWYGSGDTEFPFPGSDIVFKISRNSAAILEGVSQTVGAMITGRTTFDHSHAWGGHPPLGVHHFVMTHNPPQEWIKEGSPFTFVTDGIESAVKQAKQHAGDKDVAISSADVMRQALKAGLLDEIHIDLVPILLGEGVRLFEYLDTPIELDYTRVVEGTGVTHLAFRVIK